MGLFAQKIISKPSCLVQGGYYYFIVILDRLNANASDADEKFFFIDEQVQQATATVQAPP